MGECIVTRHSGGQKTFSHFTCVYVAIQPNSSISSGVSGLNTGDYLVIMEGGTNYAMWKIHDGICTYISSSNSWPFSSAVSISVTATQVTFTGTGGSSAQLEYVRFIKIA